MQPPLGPVAAQQTADYWATLVPWGNSSICSTSDGRTRSLCRGPVCSVTRAARLKLTTIRRGYDDCCRRRSAYPRSRCRQHVSHRLPCKKVRLRRQQGQQQLHLQRHNVQPQRLSQRLRWGDSRTPAYLRFHHCVGVAAWPRAPPPPL